MKKLLTILFLLFASPAWAATYYVATDGSGDFTTIAQVNAATFVAGDEILFRRGDVWRGRLILAGGSSSANIYYGAYGTGDKPHITGFHVVSTSWSQYASSNIYYINIDVSLCRIVLQNGSRLNYAVWDTDIATTSATMTAGTWTRDSTNNILYVYATDGANPDGHTIEYINEYHAISSDSVSYITIDGLYVSGGMYEAIRFGYNDYPTGSRLSHYGIIKNCTIRYAGSRGIVINGNYANVNNNDISEYNELINTVDNGGIVIYGHDNIVENNYIHDSIWGSAIEINSAAAYPYVSYNNIVRNNQGVRITNQLVEIWVSRNNYVYNNYGYEFGYGLNKVGIKITNGSYGNTIYNNVLISSDSRGLEVSYPGTTGIYPYDNIFLHNTIIQTGSTSNGYGINVNAAGYKNNIFRNNVCYMNSAVALRCYDDDNTFDNNCYYRAAGDLIDWNGTTYTLAQFAAYQTATSQDLHSIAADPLLSPRYRLKPGSPAINAGASVGVTTDYLGNARDSQPDIGAMEAGNFFHNATLRNCTLQ